MARRAVSSRVAWSGLSTVTRAAVMLAVDRVLRFWAEEGEFFIDVCF